MSNILVDAVRAWIAVAQSILPVYSGASLSTIIHLAGLVGVTISVVPTDSALLHVGDGTFRGLASATPDAEIFLVPGRYGYKWQTTLEHLRLNDTTHVTKAHFEGADRLIQPTPYQFKEQAEIAFQKVVDHGLARIDFNAIWERSVKRKKVRF